VCLTSLRTNFPPMPPKLNQKRALFVLSKIDEILAWERRNEAEKDTRFVELGRYLCEVRAGQYWRLESSDKFRGYCLEMICADFLAGANLDSAQPEVLLHSLSRFFQFLPGEQRQAFVQQLVNGKTQ
jgi:hypothetical protein